MKTFTISTRLDKQQVNDLENFAKIESLDKSKFLKKLINKSLKEYKIRHALSLYSKKRLSLGKAAEVAGLNIWDFIDSLKRHRISLNYSEENLKNDLKTLSEL